MGVDKQTNLIEMRTLLSIILTVVFSLSVLAQKEESVFSFAGKVYLGTEKGEDVKISLFDNNKKISSYKTAKNAKFIIDVERNKHYTIQFEKKGYITKRLIIDTYVNERDAMGVKTFKFDVELFKEEKGKNYAILDFPIAIIEFNHISKEFSYNQKYTKSMLDVQDDVLTGKRVNIAAN